MAPRGVPFCLGLSQNGYGVYVCLCLSVSLSKSSSIRALHLPLSESNSLCLSLPVSACQASVQLSLYLSVCLSLSKSNCLSACRSALPRPVCPRLRLYLPVSLYLPLPESSLPASLRIQLLRSSLPASVRARLLQSSLPASLPHLSLSTAAVSVPAYRYMSASVCLPLPLSSPVVPSSLHAFVSSQVQPVVCFPSYVSVSGAANVSTRLCRSSAALVLCGSLESTESLLRAKKIRAARFQCQTQRKKLS